MPFRHSLKPHYAGNDGSSVLLASLSDTLLEALRDPRLAVPIVGAATARPQPAMEINYSLTPDCGSPLHHLEMGITECHLLFLSGVRLRDEQNQIH